MHQFVIVSTFSDYYCYFKFNWFEKFLTSRKLTYPFQKLWHLGWRKKYKMLLKVGFEPDTSDSVRRYDSTYYIIYLLANINVTFFGVTILIFFVFSQSYFLVSALNVKIYLAHQFCKIISNATLWVGLCGIWNLLVYWIAPKEYTFHTKKIQSNMFAILLWILLQLNYNATRVRK